jgi:anaerobic selenocysteine-containing dehydrogenase
VATKSDHWLPIKPGTDTALLLAWLHVLIDEDLYDADYLDRWATGFDRLQRSMWPTRPPTGRRQITDLGADQIRDTASGRWLRTRREPRSCRAVTSSGMGTTPSGCAPSTWSTP